MNLTSTEGLLLTNGLLVAVTIAYVWLTRRSAVAAEQAASQAQVAAEAAQRQAEAAERAEAYAVLPIVVCRGEFIPYGGSDTTSAHVKTAVTNVGRGTALNVGLRVTGVPGFRVDWTVLEDFLRPDDPTVERYLVFPNPDASDGGNFAVEAAYEDQTGRRYMSTTDIGGVVVSLVVVGPDGAERVAEPLIRYPGAFD